MKKSNYGCAAQIQTAIQMPTQVKISSVGEPRLSKVIFLLSVFSKAGVSSLGRWKYVFFL
jgi:hypothetical protein